MSAMLMVRMFEWDPTSGRTVHKLYLMWVPYLRTPD